MDVNFELYKIFYHAAKYGSFSAAAEKLYITQSAVSQAIKNLENKIGDKLFSRKSRTIQLTEEGATLFKYVEQAYNFLKAGEGKILEMRNMELGEIRIGVGDTICKYFLIPYLRYFNVKYPRIKLRVINRTSPQIVEALKNGLIDIGIATLPINDKNITTSNFMLVKDIFVASDKFSSLKNKKISLDELSDYPLLMLEKESATRHNLDIFLKDRGIEIAPEIELESIDLLVEFACIGLGIAYVLKESAVAAIQQGDLFVVETLEEPEKRELGILIMKDVPVSHAVETFILLLKEGIN